MKKTYIFQLHDYLTHKNPHAQGVFYHIIYIILNAAWKFSLQSAGFNWSAQQNQILNLPESPWNLLKGYLGRNHRPGEISSRCTRRNGKSFNIFILFVKRIVIGKCNCNRVLNINSQKNPHKNLNLDKIKINLVKNWNCCLKSTILVKRCNFIPFHTGDYY